MGVSQYPPSSAHTHDDRYYTQSETDTELDNATGRILDGTDPFTGNIEFQNGVTVQASSKTSDEDYDAYPDGYSYAGAASSSWPGDGAGTVHTWNRGDSASTHQMFMDGHFDGPRVYTRRRQSSGWTPWRTVS